MFGHDSARSGVDVGDTILTTSNVSQLVEKWQISLGGQVADSTPILLGSVLYQTAKNGETFAINAKTGAILWTYSTSGPNITQSTPVADPSGSSIYVPGIDGMIHKLNASTGAEITGGGFPATLTLIPSTEKDASPLNLANGYLYATVSGNYGDAPYYDGHVIAVNLSSGAETVYNTLCSNITTLISSSSTCSNSDSGIWSRGAVVVDPDPAMNGAVYVATGNGLYDGGDNWGDSVLSLTSNLSMLMSAYTPTNYTTLQDDDTDLGSTSPALLPRQTTSTTPLMLVQGGKDKILRLLNRDPLPGVANELQEITLPYRLYATPAVWTSSGVTWIFFALPNQIDAYELETSGGTSSLVSGWVANDGTTSGEGTSPVVSNGIVFVAMDNALYALAATSGAELWSSTNAGVTKTIGPVHWESPIVVNGWVYCSDQNGNLTAYGLP